MYKLLNEGDGNFTIQRVSDGAYIPRSLDNRDYYKFLQDVKVNTTSIIDIGDFDIPSWVQTAADAAPLQETP